MKKWMKWVIGIIGVLMVTILIFSVLFWSRLSILMGTEELSGKTEAIPGPVSRLAEPLTEGDADWISWHGARGDRRSDVKGIIRDWSGGLERLWEVDYLCQGNSSAAWSAPVVQGNRLVVCGRGTDSDLIFCFDPTDGTLLWQASYGAKAGASHGRGPRATPAIDDDRVYTFGRGGDLICWELFDGRAVWRANVSDEGGEAPTWGHASSPLILGERVIVQGGGTARTIAYDKMTGKVAWKSGRGLAGYAALTAMDLDGKPGILVFHGKGLAALDAGSGDELWHVSWETPYDVNATTPIAIGDRVFITSGYGTGCMLLKVGRTGAEVLWQSKIIAAHDGTVDKYTGDGIMAFWGAPARLPDHAVRACRAAILCQRMARQLNEKWIDEGQPALNIRIGIHTGETVVGNIGSSERLNYSALGDSVNIASRLEELNKTYATRIIVSQATYERTSAEFVYRPLDVVTVRGRKGGLRICELMDEEDYASPAEARAVAEQFREAFDACIGEDWPQAAQLLERFLDEYPHDLPARVLLDRCRPMT